MKYLLPFVYLFILSYSCTPKAYHNDPIPEHQDFSIYSDIIGEERIINVWTPPQYMNQEGALPVLYMADGGIKEDFPHIANTLSMLIQEKKNSTNYSCGN